MDKAKETLKPWLPIAAVTTILCGLAYLSVQQDLRMSANDPQIQMAEDAAQGLTQGAAVDTVVPTSQIDIARSLAPFVIVFDNRGNPLASSGLLQGEIPHLPPGVLDYVRQNGEDRITWQPQPGVRMASVVVGFSGVKSGFVLAARSLREIEKREDQAELEAGLAWIAALGVSLIVVALGAFLLGSDSRTK